MMVREPTRLHPRPLTTRALCETANVTRGQLRIYEREGLILPPARTASGYRNFAPDTVARLQAIRQLKDIGFTLAQIGALLAEGDDGELDADRMRSLAQEQLEAIDARIARLKFVRRFVAAVAAGDMTALNDPECSFLVEFLASGARKSRRRRA